MNGCCLYVVWILKLNPYLSLTQTFFPGRKQLRQCPGLCRKGIGYNSYASFLYLQYLEYGICLIQESPILIT